jgi:hypothetical protein
MCPKTVSVQNLEGTENGTEMGLQRRHVGGEGRVHGGLRGRASIDLFRRSRLCRRGLMGGDQTRGQRDLGRDHGPVRTV